MHTHYITYWTQVRPDGKQLAVCRIFVNAAEHSVEPTCPTCAAYLVPETGYRSYASAEENQHR